MMGATTQVVMLKGMGMVKPPLGDQELETLRYISENAPLSVGEAASGFGEPRGLARTTVLTVMERLRQKGYLARRKQGGVFKYTPQVAQPELLKGLVGEFVEKTLGGSLTPFVAYLADSADLSEEELAALQRIVDSLPAREVER